MGLPRVSMMLLAVVLLASCTLGAPAEMARAPDSYDASSAPAEPEAAGGEQFAGLEDQANQVSFQRQQAQERLIIRTGRMAIVVENTEDSLRQIGLLVDAADGWVVGSDVFQSNGAKAGTITIRVPAEQFDNTVASIRELALEVRSESTSSEDVTEEFVDLEARLANLEATADRVRGFLDSARNTEEALAVNQELSRLESDIEALKGRINYLSQSAAFSTLTVQLTPDELSQPIEVAGWRPEGVARQAIETLAQALQALGSILIWSAIFCLPLIIIIGLPAYIIFRFGYRRWRRRSDATQAATSDEDEPENQDEQHGQIS